MEQYNPRDKFRSLKHIYIMNTSLKILSSDRHAALHNALPGANPFRTFDSSNYLIRHQDNFLVILTHHHFANL